MAAPSSDLVVTNPPSLNAATRKWPYRVIPFPAQWLLDYAGLGRGNAPQELPQNPPNKLRYED